MVAGGLVSAAVFSVSPAFADHCDPAEQHQGQQTTRAQRPGQDEQAPDGQDQGQQDQGQNDQGQNDQDQGQDNRDQGQNQDQGQQRNQQRDNRQDNQQQDNQDQGFEQQGTGGGALSPAPDPTGQDQNGQSRDGQNRNGQDPNNNQDQGQDDQDQGDQQADRNGQDQDDQQAGEPTQDANTLFRRRGRGNQQQPTRRPTPSPSPTAGGENECADLGPFLTDFVDIRQVQPTSIDAPRGRGGSRGTFVSACGTNRNGHNNPDNFIVAPGVSNGAHHLHDYVGNVSTNGFSTDESLAAAGTTCRFGDRSTYFWPVLRDRKVDVNTGDPDGNVGQVLRARSVTLQFRGNAVSRVTAMPRFLRLITGDAKAATNGGANARAAWTCTGFQNRITTKYPLCPRGSGVVRILDFPSCWDGQNTDSANHRTHVVFPDQSGACPGGMKAVPQLRMTLVYSVPQGPSFAVDAFPEQQHNPITDHADFANVMPDRLMAFVVNCINRGRRC
ncbi:DUF1996 domain-containing protein [Nonomuraea rhodomycinica]|uniref:DUF1996 domain-containing protein n=2 Tax=Nonomuraea rhodomycinica TaxID=1712872 RepID=A0A7Y6INC5_9ACTN|nr:DUF1996 domain-containing protein [Nonomuraea rhodomycinica]